MKPMLVFPAGGTDACRYASRFLEKNGVALVDHPSPEVTHLLLDVPSFGPDGALRGGGSLEALLEMLPETITIVGGNLSHAALSGYRALDLLQDTEYLARNAAITADCALRVAAQKLPIAFDRCQTLVIGWGRIGKCLGKLLKALGADVTIAARKEADRAMIQALGFEAADTAALKKQLPRYRLIFNTVPQLILVEADMAVCRDCVKIELASRPGMAGKDVTKAKGLPGILEPESSGSLIAKTILRLVEEEKP